MSRQTNVLIHWGRAYHSIPDLDVDLPIEVLDKLGARVQDAYPEILIWPEIVAAEAYLYFLSECFSVVPEQALLKTVRRDQEFILFIQERMKKHDANNACKQYYSEAIN
jgi:hypothetical protein